MCSSVTGGVWGWRGGVGGMIVADNWLPPWRSLAVFQFGTSRGLNSSDECSHTLWMCQTEEENHWDSNWHDGKMWERGRERQREEGLFMRGEGRKKERHQNVSTLVPRSQPYFWKQIHLNLYGAGKWKQSSILIRRCIFNMSRYFSRDRLEYLFDMRSFFHEVEKIQSLRINHFFLEIFRIIMHRFHVKKKTVLRHCDGNSHSSQHPVSGVCLLGENHLAYKTWYGNLFGMNREITGKGDTVIHIMSHDGWTKISFFFFRSHKLKLVTLLVKADSNTVGLTSGEIQCKTTSVITRSSNDEAVKKKKKQ